jgi:hypothetical protein
MRLTGGGGGLIENVLVCTVCWCSSWALCNLCVSEVHWNGNVVSLASFWHAVNSTHWLCDATCWRMMPAAPAIDNHCHVTWGACVYTPTFHEALFSHVHWPRSSQHVHSDILHRKLGMHMHKVSIVHTLTACQPARCCFATKKPAGHFPRLSLACDMLRWFSTAVIGTRQLQLCND